MSLAKPKKDKSRIKVVHPLNEDEMDTLLTAMCLLRSVRAEALQFNSSDVFKPGELGKAVLFEVIRELHESHIDGEVLPYRDVRLAFLEQVINLGSALPTEEKDDVMAEPDEPGDPVGILHHAYKVVKPGEISEKSAFKLLRRFLTERLVDAPIKEAAQYSAACSIRDFTLMLDDRHAVAARITSIGSACLKHTSLGERWAPHEKMVDRDRGKGLLGLKTDVPELDRRTMGLRGVVLVGARPGGGKTALAVHCAVGVCKNYTVNDAVCLFLSLEMDADKIISRVKSHVSGLDWVRYRAGSPDRDDWVDGHKLDQNDLAALRRGKKAMKSWQLDKRLFVLDRANLGEVWDATRVVRLAQEARSSAGASRVLVIVDHLQYVPLAALEGNGSRSENEADKARMGVVKAIARGLKTEQDPDPAILLIAQSRKPPTAKDDWGASLSEFLGSVEIPFAADAGLVLRYMNSREAGDYYTALAAQKRAGKAGSKKTVEDRNGVFLERWRMSGISPIIANLDKAREGMIPGHWAMEFDYRRFVFQSVSAKRSLSELPRDDDDAVVTAAEGLDRSNCEAEGQDREMPQQRVEKKSRATSARKERMVEVLRANPGASLRSLAEQARQSHAVAALVLDELVELGQAAKTKKGYALIEDGDGTGSS
jgi:DnaB-like helicase C terminal domain